MGGLMKMLLRTSVAAAAGYRLPRGTARRDPQLDSARGGNQLRPLAWPETQRLAAGGAGRIDRDEILAQHPQGVALNDQGCAFVNAQSDEIGVFLEHAEEPRLSLTLREMLIDDGPFQEAKAGADAGVLCPA